MALYPCFPLWAQMRLFCPSWQAAQYASISARERLHNLSASCLVRFKTFRSLRDEHKKNIPIKYSSRMRSSHHGLIPEKASFVTLPYSTCSSFSWPLPSPATPDSREPSFWTATCRPGLIFFPHSRSSGPSTSSICSHVMSSPVHGSGIYSSGRRHLHILEYIFTCVHGSLAFCEKDPVSILLSYGFPTLS